MSSQPLDDSQIPAPVEVEPTSVPSPDARVKGGRNVVTATVVGLGMLAVVFGSLLIWKPAFLIAASAALCLAIWELAQAFERKDIRLPLLPLWVGTVGICVSSYTAGLEGTMVALMLTVAAVVVWRVVDGGGLAAVRDAAGGIFAIGYIPLMGAFVMLLLAADNGEWKVLFFILLAVANDVGGFFVGVRFGKHPLAPSVSPKKSWEGLAGSLILCLIVAAVGTRLLDLDLITGVILGLLIPVTATLGDLAESLIKRDLSIKDMSSVLPGHGGILDRIDSMLLTAPFAYVVLSVSTAVSA